MFCQDRILEMRRLILADNEEEIKIALKLLYISRRRLLPNVQAVQDKPMIIRL